MNASYFLLAGVVVTSLCTVYAEFNPNVTVTSCSSTTVVIHTKHTREGGIIYIQERGMECKQVTSAQSRDYIFNFDLCNITLDTMFRVIVQERPDIQTGSDKVIPVMCIVDMGEIIVGNVIMPHGELGPGINKTTKPTAQMRIISDHSNDVSQGTVLLSDELRMEVSLDSKFRDNFQISATDCSASEFNIIRDRCAEDDEIFPNFDRNPEGSLVSNFKAFIPTNYEGIESIDMTYSCTLVVCQGSCEPTVCRQVVGWGKKKRRKRSSREKDVDRITVGTTVRVISPHAKHSGVNQSDATDDIMNINRYVLYVLAGLGFLSLVASWILSCYLYNRLLAARGDDTGKINVARAVGRRLSAMLNIPSGYELSNQKRMHMLPEEEGSPHRRKSVTVSVPPEVTHASQDIKSPEPTSGKDNYFTDVQLDSDNDDSSLNDDESVSSFESRDVNIVTNVDDVRSVDLKVKRSIEGRTNSSREKPDVLSSVNYVHCTTPARDDQAHFDFEVTRDVPKQSRLIDCKHRTMLKIGFEDGFGGESDTDSEIKVTNI